MQNMTNAGGLFDPEDATEEQLEIIEQQRLANLRINAGIEDDVMRLELRIECELREISGDYKDEVSLLNQVGGRFFQGIPEYVNL